MKKYWFYIIGTFLFISCQTTDHSYFLSIQKERQVKDSLFAIAEESPLNTEQIEDFQGLNYFPIDEKYRVTAKLIIFDSGAIVQMQTSTDRLPDYRKYAKVVFSLDGSEHELIAYQNLAHQDDSLYKNLLFLPFTDNNSTILTYGGGRYIDFAIPDSDLFILDFNRAYNPYCAYNHRWSCVIPPRENSLNIPINAGEKNYEIAH